MTSRRATSRPFPLLCLCPLAWALAFAAVVLRARLASGQSPAPYRPDPAELGFGMDYVALLLGETGLCALPLVLLPSFAMLRRSRRPPLRDGWWLSAHFLLTTGPVPVQRANPGKLAIWFGD